jgi:DNA-binding transcriptional LysR family regulator
MSHLQEGSLDLVFDLASSALESDSLEQVALWEAQTGFISARLDVPTKCSLGALENVPFILFQKGTRMETIIQNYLDGLNFRPNVVMRSDSSEAIKAIIRAGLGISVLFLWNVTSDLADNTVSVIQTEAPSLTLRMALIKVKTSYASTPILKFVELAQHMAWEDLRPAGNGSLAHD